MWYVGVQAKLLKIIILPLRLSAGVSGVVCCSPPIFKPSLGRRNGGGRNSPKKYGGGRNWLKSREDGDLPSCTSPLLMRIRGKLFWRQSLHAGYWFLNYVPFKVSRHYPIGAKQMSTNWQEGACADVMLNRIRGQIRSETDTKEIHLREAYHFISTSGKNNLPIAVSTR